MPSSQNPAGRGAILLLDDSPRICTTRVEHLVRRGFRVQLASSVREAEMAWRPAYFTLVLVTMSDDLHGAVEFCDRIKNEHPLQTIGVLVPPVADFPVTRCPDLMWPEEDLDRFLARVDTLADFAASA